MQPYYEVSLIRPWHWGIAILSAVDAAVPESLGESRVTSTSECLVIQVRHAQDIEAAVFEGDWDWATAAVHLRSVPDFEEPTGTVLYEGLLALPDGRLSVGDADSQVIVTDLPTQTRVRVQTDDLAEYGVSAVQVDLAP
ncbi:hypothetical protein EV646_109100 [Kribbella antiqua]|uniref:Immunity protein 21 of polymorphic toxin system n=1 Tax=Kribbella antiqua TaxID=2512217 RepID=A0A4R2ILW8_9ACTN|nr:hypothetical protein [Kribbella antiqua]TCO44928.1 hypothetical protein EV646_109100 [Kribbella antiqua]